MYIQNYLELSKSRLLSNKYRSHTQEVKVSAENIVFSMCFQRFRLFTSRGGGFVIISSNILSVAESKSLRSFTIKNYFKKLVTKIAEQGHTYISHQLEWVTITY